MTELIDNIHICAIARNEGLYLKEWVEFHRLVGVLHFTIYNNLSTDNTVEVLQPYVDSGIVELVDWPVQVPSQAPAYQHYLSNVRGPFWTAFIDCDEFLWSPSYLNISHAFATLGPPIREAAVGVNWATFGSGGKEDWEDLPVIERFTWRLADSHPVNSHIKSVIWMDQSIGLGGNTHIFAVERGTWSENGEGIGSAFSPHSSKLLRINHYYTKSRQEFYKRAARGRADGIPRDPNDALLEPPAWEVEDREIQRFLPELKERLK